MNPRTEPWPQAWHRALYGPRGFYRRAEGPAGHFSTSVAGIPQASTVMARAIVALARRTGRSVVVDLGAGRGSLIQQVRRIDPGLRCVGVDVVAAPPETPAEVEWWVSEGGALLPRELDGLSDVLVVAHEWLDVVPATVARQDPAGTWRAGSVDTRTGEQTWEAPVADEERAWLERWTDPGTDIAEVGLTRERAVADLRGRLRRSTVLLVDYGHLRHERPPQGTLVGYRHGEVLPPVPDGSMDLTAHVAVDALWASLGAGALMRARQREALAELLETPRIDQQLAHTLPSTYLHQLAEQQARRELSRDGGLGDFWWVLAESTG
ncbi:MAG: SAM-dependent methyltransferase [Ornithinimicrobium sp.]